MPASKFPKPPRPTEGARLNVLICAALALPGASVLAQARTAVAKPSPASAAAADPADPEASVPPPPTYRSTFTGYRGAGEAPVGSWRDANDAVARIGGWRVYAREAQPPEAKPPGAAAPTAPGPGEAGKGGAKPAPPFHPGQTSP